MENPQGQNESERAARVDADIGRAWCTCNLEPSETPLAQNKAVEIPASRHRRQSGGRQMPLWLRPYHTRRRRHQTSLQRKADVETACRTERTFPMVRHFGEVAAVREYLCGVIRQRGLHHRHKWARRTSEDCHNGEREAVSEGNVAENMTVPRIAIGKSPRLQSHGCDNV